MPKVTIGTYSEYKFEVGGNVLNMPVTKIVSEDDNVRNITKEVSVFEKYSTKKPLSSHAESTSTINGRDY